MSFKLLAIRPLDGCNEKFLKNLEENKIYKFCNDYSYNFDVKDDIVQINYNQTIIENFFNNNENKSNINISAIVGKNGSGKSAIVEILVASIVKLSLEINQSFINVSNLYSDYNDSKKINKIKEFEKSLKNDLGNLNVEIFYHYNIFNGNERNRIRRIIIKNNEIRVCDYIDRQKSNKYILISLDDKKNIFSKKNKKHLSESEISFFKDFFYTIVMNYSHYSYNNLEMGEWLRGVFHKNDGYQLPIVINPYRNKGNIDINSEKQLTSSRFLINILQEKELREISKEKIITHISIEINRDKFRWNETKKLDKQIFSGIKLKEEILLYVLEKFNYSRKDIVLDKNNYLYPFLRDYIIKKLIRIIHYPIYSDFNDCFYENRGTSFLNKTKKKKFFDYIKILSEDFSHNTDKLRQALFFISNLYLDENEIFEIGRNEKLLSIEELYNKIERAWQFSMKDIQMNSIFENEIFSIKESLPSIFKLNYYFDNRYSINNFDNLSSGEKQKIFSIHSIIYHYRNIKSVKEIFNINTEEKKSTIKLIYYKNVNIIFDEIELYAHPEYQKNFINDFLNAINSINKNNDNINIIFITHSPFILSDIPKQNVLFLENGRSINYENKNTFGANITDLLADSFFINDGLIGDFAKEKISITLEWLKRKANEKRKKNNQKDLFKKENITVLEFENESEEIEYHKKIINLIDEPLVKNKLKEMFIEFVSEDLEFKDEQIRQLEEKLKKLKEK